MLTVGSVYRKTLNINKYIEIRRNVQSLEIQIGAAVLFVVVYNARKEHGDR